MEIKTIDHVNLRIPADDTERAIGFYRDELGFPIEGLEAHEADEQSFFDVHLAETHVLHLWPTTEFEPPSGNNYNHVALVVNTDIDSIKAELEKSNIDIQNEIQDPSGATGQAPAVYIADPFGYRIELKANTTS
jgi:catechol 2,3-dioxygenase-like lactoylglutathione lyase family enzyme